MGNIELKRNFRALFEIVLINQQIKYCSKFETYNLHKFSLLGPGFVSFNVHFHFKVGRVAQSV